MTPAWQAKLPQQQLSRCRGAPGTVGAAAALGPVNGACAWTGGRHGAGACVANAAVPAAAARDGAMTAAGRTGGLTGVDAAALAKGKGRAEGWAGVVAGRGACSCPAWASAGGGDSSSNTRPASRTARTTSAMAGARMGRLPRISGLAGDSVPAGKTRNAGTSRQRRGSAPPSVRGRFADSPGAPCRPGSPKAPARRDQRPCPP
jgi:hypothetical protein